jgi:hypothetical protein
MHLHLDVAAARNPLDPPHDQPRMPVAQLGGEVVTGPVLCADRGGAVRAFWWWTNGETRRPLCDGHAAGKDLDDLTEIGSLP